MRALFTILLACGAGIIHAQLDIPVRIGMTGATGADRQITGIVDPLRPDAAVSVDASRAAAMNTTGTTGSTDLVGALIPAPASLTPGMLITIIPQEANAAGAVLELNGTGSFPLVKWGNIPVDSADLAPGIPARLVFDGSRFQVITTLSKPCPAGASAGSALFCIDDSTLLESSFYEATLVCEDRGGRLCSFGEWSSYCRKTPGFISTVNAYEWVDDAANNNNDAKTVGGGYDGPNFYPDGFSCTWGISKPPTDLHRVRCCYDR